MSYRFHRTMALIMVMSLLAVVLAACGGNTGETGTGASPAASGGAGASPAASAGGAGASASPMASTGGTEASASPMASASPAGGASPAGSAQAGGGAAACPEAAQGAQVTMWSPLTGPDGDEMTALANQFGQDNPRGIKVQHVPQPEYLQKLNTAAAGRNLPDMTVIRVTDVPEMAARNILRPMNDDALSIVGVDGSDFPEEVWGGGEYKGQRYAIPLDVNAQVLYYNKDLFQQAGITMPTDRPMNRQEFEAAAEKLNANGVSGIAVGTLYSGETFFDMLIRQFGGSLANEEGTEAVYNSEAGVQAMTYLVDLKKKYSPNIQGQGDPEVTQFQQGRAAMVIHGPWHISNLEKLPFTGFAMVPQIGDEYVAVGGSHQLALTTEDPAKTAAAACWMSWLSENSVQWAKAGQIPARNSAREDAQLATISPAVAAVAKEAEAIQFPPVVPGITTATGPEGIGRAVNPILLGQQSDIKATLDQAVQRSNQLIQQNAQQYGGQ